MNKKTRPAQKKAKQETIPILIFRTKGGRIKFNKTIEEANLTFKKLKEEEK